MTEAEFVAAVTAAYNAFRAIVPIDTGNMRYNATRLESVGNGVFKIRVSEAVAPYVPYTNEPWISPRWNGKKNPNEGWFESGTELVATVLAQNLGGTVTKR